MRQTKNYSCGAACLSLLKVFIDSNRNFVNTETDICSSLEAKPFVGIDNDKMENFVKQDDFLAKYVISIRNSGIDKDKVSIANIRNWRSGIGHYVLFLGAHNGFVEIYDPLDQSFHKKRPFEDFEFCNSDGRISEWSISFDICPDAFKKFLNNRLTGNKSRQTFIIKGDGDFFNPIYDTVSYLDTRYREKGLPSMIVNESDIKIENGILFLSGVKVLKGDKIWLKIDPRQSDSYFNTLRLLSLFEDEFQFLNPPSAILKYDDKIISYIALNSKFDVCCSEKQVREFLYQKKKDFVIKRFNGCGGRDVTFSKNKSFEGRVNSASVIQEDVTKDKNIDARVLWYKGIFHGVVYRYADRNSFCNLTQGAKFDAEPFSSSLFSEEINRQLNIVSDFLFLEGVVIAGIDVLNSELLTEVNISNPSVYKNYIEVTKDDFLSDEFA